MKEKEKRLMFPHHTPERVKPSMRIFMALTLSYDFIKDFVEKWDDDCLDTCCWLEHNDDNEEYLIEVYNAIEVVWELIARATKEGKELNAKQTEEVNELFEKAKEKEKGQ